MAKPTFLANYTDKAYNVDDGSGEQEHQAQQGAATQGWRGGSGNPPIAPSNMPHLTVRRIMLLTTVTADLGMSDTDRARSIGPLVALAC